MKACVIVQGPHTEVELLKVLNKTIKWKDVHPSLIYSEMCVYVLHTVYVCVYLWAIILHAKILQ